MARSDTTIQGDIYSQIQAVDEQLDVLLAKAKFQGVKVSTLQYPDGTYPVIPLLLARSNLLLAEAIMKRKDVK